MRISILRITAILVALATIGTIPAGATNLGTVDLENHGNNFSDSGTVYGDGYPDGANTYTGVYSWTNAGGTGLGTKVPNWGFCLEISQPASDGLADVTPLNEAPLPPLYGSPMGTTKADYIRELWGRDFDPSWITGANTEIAEAFSVAIFEILYETDAAWNVNSGVGFHVGYDVEQAATANIWLNQLNVVQIPEPATLALMSMGALALLKKRKNKT
jgi:hypothetical protein